MTYQTIAQTLRESRRLHQLKQSDVAQKLGMRQSQISTLERGLVSPRLATVEDVARVLDLELMLVPRQLVPFVSGLVERNRDPSREERPLYALDGEDDHQAPDNHDPETS